MTWNYRVIRTPTGYEDEPYSFAIYEVYYDEDNNPNGWTERAVGVPGAISSHEQTLLTPLTTTQKGKSP